VRNRLRVLRAERDWSQARLADELEVSRQTVNAIETGRYDPSLPLAFRIARVFGQPIEAIFFPDGSSEAEEEDVNEPRGGALPDVSADWA
jgi:putative transcriptional regulator